jgi:hypothetical protein
LRFDVSRWQNSAGSILMRWRTLPPSHCRPDKGCWASAVEGACIAVLLCGWARIGCTMCAP